MTILAPAESDYAQTRCDTARGDLYTWERLGR